MFHTLCLYDVMLVAFVKKLGWGTGIQTLIDGVRNHSSIVELYPKANKAGGPTAN